MHGVEGSAARRVVSASYSGQSASKIRCSRAACGRWAAAEGRIPRRSRAADPWLLQSTGGPDWGLPVGFPRRLWDQGSRRATRPSLWLATVLTAQVSAGKALGIAAQLFLVWVIIGPVRAVLRPGTARHGPRRGRLQSAGASGAAFRGQPVAGPRKVGTGQLTLDIGSPDNLPW
jgi:hypothetical protein